jgi:tyrosine-protein phosphatase SIW14
MKFEDIEIKNFRQVHEWLYRGAQPSEAALRQLKEFGINTIVSFRWTLSVILQEKAIVQKLGMNLYNIPLSYWALPNRREIDRFLSIMGDEKNRPIFIHCQHGCDRTGMMIAIYRIAHEGWDVDDAYNEMRACGFHKIRVHHFKWAVYSFSQRHARLMQKSEAAKDA